MAKKDAVFIVGAMAIGVAVSESPFLLYQDLMFKNTGFDSQSSVWTYGVRGDHTLTIRPRRYALAKRTQTELHAQILRSPSQVGPVHVDLTQGSRLASSLMPKKGNRLNRRFHVLTHPDETIQASYSKKLLLQLALPF